MVAGTPTQAPRTMKQAMTMRRRRSVPSTTQRSLSSSTALDSKSTRRREAAQTQSEIRRGGNCPSVESRRVEKKGCDFTDGLGSSIRMLTCAKRFCGPVIAAAQVSAACYSAPLTEGGKTVQLMKADPPPGCREVGSVSGRGDDEEVKIAMRNYAAQQGGNYVRIETMDLRLGRGTGTAFRCPAAD